MRKEATPPQITTVEDLLAKMRAGIRQHHIIRLRDLEIPVRVVSIDEMNAIRRDAVRQAMTISGGDEVDKNVAVQKTTLKIASTVPGQAPLLSDKLLEKMTVDEVNYLYEEYVKVLDDVNPAVERMSDEKVRELVDAIKKKDLVSARDLSLVQLRTVFSLFQDMIQRLDAQRSPKDN
jgi:hypothetical protein